MPSLTGIRVPRLLLSLHQEAFSGWLQLERGPLARRFQFDRGTPVAVQSNQARDGLGPRLLEQGLVAEHQRQPLEKALRGPGSELAKIARLQLVAPRELLRALREQITACLLDVCGWQDGRFQLEPGAAPEAASGLQLDLVAVVCDAVARHWRPDEMLSALDERVSQFPAPGDGFSALLPRVGRDAATRELLKGLDGSRNAFSRVRETSNATFHAALFALDALGALAWHDRATSDPEGAADGEAASGAAIEIVVASAAAQEEEAASQPDEALRPEVEDEETLGLRREILELHARLRELDAYALLGVERGAATAQIKMAYLKLAKHLHPDALARQGLDDVKAEANAVFAEVSRAHTTLSDPDQRRSYDAALEGHTSVDADRLAQAEALYRKGEILMKAGNFLGALEPMEGAVGLWPEEADYQGALGWILYKKNPPELDRARTHLEKAVALNPEEAVLQQRLYFVCKALGDAEAAAAALAAAREIDPSLKA